MKYFNNKINFQICTVGFFCFQRTGAEIIVSNRDSLIVSLTLVDVLLDLLVALFTQI